VTHPHTKALAEAIDALESIALAGMSGTGQESDGAMTAWHARRAWEFIRTAARALEPARAALALPQEQAPGAEPVTDAAWEVTNQGRYIYCDRFEHDIRLTIDGDFESDAERVAFAKACAVKLCSAPSSPGAAEAGETVAGEKLWLWKNGDHYLAYRHLYPCFTPGGDPMTLGEPVGYALIRESHDRATPSKPHFMSMEAAQNRATQREHGRIDGMVGALKKIQEERKAEAEARPVGELPPLPEPVKKGAMDCEDCDGRGGDGEWHYQGEFQPPEQEPCSSCNGSGRWKLNLYTGQQMCDYARQALSAAPREVAGWKFAPAGDAIKVTDPSGLSWWVCDGMPQERPHSLGIFLHPLFATLAAAAPQEGTT
jgi:hypothetical protein